MPLNYDPQDAVMCWPADDYDAELVKVEDKTSKAGNPMQVLTWKVFHESGQEQLISDYIVIPTGTFKLKQLALALNKKADFEAGTFQADDQIGCTVKAELVIERQDGYDDKNKIKKVKSAASTSIDTKPEYKPLPKREVDPVAAKAQVIAQDAGFTDDSIPF